MEKRNMIIIAIVAVACIAMAALYFSGGYSFDGPYDLEGRAIYKASSNGGLSLSDNNVEVNSGATIKIHDGGSMVYEGS